MERRHHQHIGRARQAAERVGRGQLRIERHVGGHFAVIFEIDPLAVEDLHRLDHPRRALALRMAEGGEGQQRQPRLIAEPARDAGRFDGDLGEFLGASAFR